MTLQQIARDAMDAVLRGILEKRQEEIKRRGFYQPDFAKIESAATTAINDMIVMANLGRGRNESRIPAQKRLEPWQIAEILAAATDIVQAAPSVREKRTSLRVRLHDGTLSENDRPIRQAALELNSALTERRMSQVLDRLRLLCPERPEDRALETPTG